MVGSAIEHAAELKGETIDFSQLFLDVEAEDEEAATTADVLSILDRQWPNKQEFGSADVRRFLQKENSDGQEKIDIATLKSFIMTDEQIIPAGGTVTKQLKLIVDLPTLVGEDIFILKTKTGDAETRKFWVEAPKMEDRRM